MLVLTGQAKIDRSVLLSLLPKKGSPLVAVGHVCVCGMRWASRNTELARASSKRAVLEASQCTSLPTASLCIQLGIWGSKGWANAVAESVQGSHILYASIFSAQKS
jgi:hypothetical protein